MKSKDESTLTAEEAVFCKPENTFLLSIGLFNMACVFGFSALYHFLSDYSPRARNISLKLDLVGVVLIIFAQAFIGVHLGFKEHPVTQRNIFIVLSLLFVSNLSLNSLPCYASTAFHQVKVWINFSSLAIRLIFVLIWRFFYASYEEIEIFFPLLILSYIVLTTAFIFYKSGLPEKVLTKQLIGESGARFVQLYLQSHTLWHIFVTGQICLQYRLGLRAILYY